MNFTPDAAGKAGSDISAFTTYLLQADGVSFSLQRSLGDLTGGKISPETRGLMLHEDPTVAIARHLQAGRPLPEALADWRSVAQEHLGVCRKLGRRIVLSRTLSGADAETGPLSALLQERFPDAALPALNTSAENPDPFFVALATLGAEQSDATLVLIQELQARSINTPADLPETIACLQALQTRWQARQGHLTQQIQTRNQNIKALTADRDAARKAEQAEHKTNDLLSGQISQLEKALSAQETLNTEYQAANKAHEAKALEMGAQVQALNENIKALTADRDAARKTGQEKDQINSLLSGQISQLEEALSAQETLNTEYETASKAHEAKAREMHAQVQALNKNNKALSADRDAARKAEQAEHKTNGLLNGQISQLKKALNAQETLNTKYETASKAHEAKAREMGAQVQALNKNNKALSADRDAARKAEQEKDQINSLLSGQISQLEEGLSAAASTQDALIAEHETAKKITALLGSQVNQLKDSLGAAVGAKDKLQAQHEASRTAHKAQTATLSTRIQALTGTVKTLTKERDTTLAQLQEAKQIETLLGGQLNELRQALSKAASTEDALESTRHLLTSTQGDRANKQLSRDTLKQQARQLEIALTMTEKRRAEARHDCLALQAENEQLQEQLDALHGSTSWRLTTPMRSISRLVRK